MDLNVVSDAIQCEYCDSVITLPLTDSPSEVMELLRQANICLYACEFNKAYDLYKLVSEKSPNEPEAYFGMALAEFQVQYLHDEVNNCEQPVCYDISEKPFTDNCHYQKAAELASPAQKIEYARRGETIDAIHNEFYKLSSAGVKYDCFICCKVTSDDAARTATYDAYQAARLYNYLEKNGYKPFYSEFDVVDKMGADYEALILYALYTAKCMIVVCLDKGYLRTKWVKNEYSRFLNMVHRAEKADDALSIAYGDTVIEKLSGSNKKYQGVSLTNSPAAYSIIVDFVKRHVSQTDVETADGKYCRQCGKENALDAKFCGECGNTEFADTLKEYIAEETRKRVEAEYAAKLETEKKERERLEAELNRMRESKDNNAQEEKDVASVTEKEIEEWFQKGVEYYERNNYAEAFKLWKKAAEQGNARAQFNLGYCYENGMGVEQNYAEAVKWYRKATEQGQANAQLNLGYCYRNGMGVEQNYEEAVSWYRKAAAQGNAAAQFNLGVCYKNGEGVEQNYEEAVNWYRKAAEQGDADAQCNLGYCYRNGMGVKQNYEEAVNWYRKAAEQGDAAAQFNLGVCYENGEGVEQDYAEAVKWYRKAAEQGNATSQCNLGVCYENGEGVEQDYAEAIKWYRKAAEQGDADAQFNLGVCYDNGRGVKQDYAEAIKWYDMAAKQGYKNAMEASKRLKKLYSGR